MFVLSIVTLLIAFLAALLSLKTEEEIVKVAFGCASVLMLLLTLIVAPWPLKLPLVAVPLIWDKVSAWSTEKLPY